MGTTKKMNSIRAFSGFSKGDKLVYLAGPVSGLPRHQVELAFTNAETALNLKGYIVMNPVAIIDEKVSWEEAMKIAITVLMPCDYICVLPGWEGSKGACIEIDLATRIGIKVVKVTDLI